LRRGSSSRVSYWCSEANVRWFLASVARRCGYGLVLSLQLGEPLTLSKKEIERGCRDLPENLVQGRHVVDLAAYRGTTLVVGLALSRLLVRAYARGEDAVKGLIGSMVSPPRECIEFFERSGKLMGLTSMQACLLYKLGRSLPLHGRVRRFMGSVDRVVLTLVVLGRNERVVSVARECLDKLVQSLSQNGQNTAASLYTLRPVDWEEGPPRLVKLVRMHGEEVFESGDYPWTEIMGTHFLGCVRCPYLSTCMSLWR